MAAPNQTNVLKIEQETTYGETVNASWTYLPYDEFGLQVENEVRVHEKATGSIDNLYVQITEQNVRGSLTLQIFPEITSLIIGMCGITRFTSQNSYSIVHREEARAEDVIYVGAMVDTYRFEASTGDPSLKCSMDLIAKSEAPSTIAIGAATLPSGNSWILADATITIGGLSETNVESFRIEGRNNLRPSGWRNASRQIQRLYPQTRDVELTFDVVAQPGSGTQLDYAAWARNMGTDLTFVANFEYPGTGSGYDNIIFTLGECVVRSAARNTGIRDLEVLTVTATCAKPAATASIVISAS